MRNKQYYLNYINSPEWRIVRERYFNSTLPQVCWACNKPKQHNYNLHHKTYSRLGGEYLSDLCLLCPDCHQKCHDYIDRKGLKLWEGTTRFIRESRASKNLPLLDENEKAKVEIFKAKRRRRNKSS